MPKSLNELPSHLDGQGRDIWREILDNAPPGLLAPSDRFAVELAVVVIRKFRSPDSRGAGYTTAASILRSCGLTPKSRLKILGPKHGKSSIQ